MPVGPPSPPGRRGPPGLPFAATYAACLLKNLERAGQLLHFHYDHAEVDVIARRQDSPPKFVEVIYELRLATDDRATR